MALWIAGTLGANGVQGFTAWAFDADGYNVTTGKQSAAVAATDFVHVSVKGFGSLVQTVG